MIIGKKGLAVLLRKSDAKLGFLLYTSDNNIWFVTEDGNGNEEFVRFNTGYYIFLGPL
jgi:hypothetical protein